MRVLVTGGAGFIGSHIVDSLLAEGVEVAVLDNLSTGKRENVPQGIYFYKVDLRDREGVERVFREFRPTHVSHQAAQASVKVSVENPLLDFEVNLLGGLHLLEACRKWGVEKLLFASTGGAIYGEVPEGEAAEETWPPKPKSPYAASKAGFEGYLSAYGQNYGLKWVSLRYANVYGPRQDPHGEAGVVAIFAERVLKGEAVTLYARKTPGDEGCVRDYIYVEDVVRAHNLALRGLEGVYNVGTGEGHTTLEVLEGVAEAAGKAPLVQPAPPRPGDLERSVLSPLKLMAHGWRPEVGFKEGIRRTVEYFRSR
ncbi:MAG: NAD-dependent epimerase/dehydratase family protein [Thermus sp.]|uniref:NAD-dependent epimerase/dehydratase family protein n=1 Tax=Thermus sp. TaxID=275 RepID=UPI0025E669BC|nr:NAD-dependent epimerase/dehydratase family protein [Thermus sp.]MCS6868989.1 NAD-dependent epimerase/dehydratase family protein [Thermus sp.]MCS7218964.1 NAD-dependent epimerase/dehydratase family protein [Thermus sp.]MCX7848949.1 NAD-dependent epimerase/dehydratase family protein [Thermus sp.]MDW8018025.1 NAD-dependent epimerase/dehydratase family protein [Thermus sp.]MDW8356893.1 NAD-dependent epimerase/dehydratase family protein [Thermus sp.]